MKKYILGLLLIIAGAVTAMAQADTYDAKASGTCGKGCKWIWDGFTLTIYSDSYESTVRMEDYNTSAKLSPWKKKNLSVRKVRIDKRVSAIGDCAFYDLPLLEEVEMTDPDLRSIGWGAFMDCRSLKSIKFPGSLREIGKIAFANCNSLTSVTIPDNCAVGELAFASCSGLQTLNLSATSMIGRNAFAGETMIDGKPRHTLFTGTVIQAPSYITQSNCQEYGLAKSTIAEAPEIPLAHKEYTYSTSAVDTRIPDAVYMRNNTYALIIGNQDYRYASDVPGALHDANIFKEYCRKTLGIAADNIHLVENATKEMIMTEEIGDWLGELPERNQKTLLVYYAGNGIPDAEDGNNPYLLPVDMRGSNPSRGISLDSFYRALGDLGFNQTTVFIDASFSGLNRYNEGVADGSGAPPATPKKIAPTTGNVVAITASEGPEAALGLPDEGHGLFTYCLLNVLKDTNGVLSMGTLYDRLRAYMPKAADTLKRGKTQTPSISTSDTLSSNWRSVRM